MNLADDPELLALMKAAGFIRVSGYRDASRSEPKEANITDRTPQRSLLDSVRCIQQHGIEVMAGFIVGFDSDPDDVFDRQVEFIEDRRYPDRNGRPSPGTSRHAAIPCSSRRGTSC